IRSRGEKLKRNNIQDLSFIDMFVTLKTWGCKSPFLVMITYNKNVRRWFRMSKNQSNTKLEDGWNQIQFNLSDLTKTAFGTNYMETLRVQIHVNRRIRRVFFTERLYSPLFIISSLEKKWC
uniref:CFA20 domain-containing protein n=1 Tax=Oryzias latipes TaxID=8090 RepID=A0A3B3I0G7_ORYLA